VADRVPGFTSGIAVGADVGTAEVDVGAIAVGSALGEAAGPQDITKSNTMSNEIENARTGNLGRDIKDLNLIDFLSGHDV
jgi:hypothetical protein